MVKLEIPSRRIEVFPQATSSITHEWLESDVLRDNPMGDPVRRQISVLLPPSGQSEGRPLVVHLPGFTGAGGRESNRPAFLGESLFGLFDRLMRTGAMPEAVLVAPDCLTSLGGSQYVNSRATGNYADHVVREVIPWAVEKFHLGRVGIVGQSSGGFGALHLAAEFPGVFSAVGTSAADVAFDQLFLPEFPRAVRTFRRFGGPEKFLTAALTTPGVVKGPFDPTGAAFLVLAMAACYSPSDGRGGEVDLPFDLETGELVAAVWRRWLAFDPIQRLAQPRVCEGYRSLRRLHLTASSDDEWYLDIAARRMARALSEHGIPFAHDEMAGSHFDKLPRFGVLFPSLVRALESAE